MRQTLKKRIFSLGLALVLFWCLVPQTMAMSPDMDMDPAQCSIQMLCAACSFTLQADSPELAPDPTSHRVPSLVTFVAPDIYQEPLYHPPR